MLHWYSNDWPWPYLSQICHDGFYLRKTGFMSEILDSPGNAEPSIFLLKRWIHRGVRTSNLLRISGISPLGVALLFLSLLFSFIHPSSDIELLKWKAWRILKRRLLITKYWKFFLIFVAAKTRSISSPESLRISSFF